MSGHRWSTRMGGVALVVALALTTLGGAAQAERRSHQPSHPAPSAAVPSVTGPLPAPGPDAMFASYPLARVGYSASELFFSGTAKAYAASAPLTADGKWAVQPASSAAYKSRIIVARPTDPRRFNGTVIVEWMNVTSGSDANIDWSFGHDEMIRSGFAYVGISAQAAGVNALKASNPARYGSLVHPGDSFSYDIYSQAGMAVRRLTSTILPGLRPRIVLADGESQSAIRMTTYVNAVAPLVNVFDGYLIHSRSGGSAPLSQAPQADIPTPATVFIREDSTAPVLTLLSETDVLGVLKFFPARQADSSHFRLWEVAGTAHVDSYVSLQALDDDTSWASDLAQFSAMSSPVGSLSVSLPSGPLVLQCSAPFNTGEHHYVYNSALQGLNSWVRTGFAPRPMPRLEVDTSSGTPTYKLDANGNVLGGIRTPAVDAPLATLSGLAPTNAPAFCVFFGQTHPFTPSKIADLYPTHGAFVRRWLQAGGRDQQAGYLLPADARKLAEVVAPDRWH